MHRCKPWLHAFCALILSSIPLIRVHAQTPASADRQKPPDIFDALKYRFIGPPGNRVSAVVGVPGDPNIYYAGAASGGVWKSVDGGEHWYPMFDKELAQSIGTIAIAPSNHSIVWVGTGETFIRSNVSLGDGIYKSVDGGKTWAHLGLEKTGRIGRILIDPTNPDVVYAAALGTCYGPQQERGVFRTRDGGKTWQRVLFVDEQTGASDLTMDPKNPQKLIAGMWQIDIKTWGRKSGGAGSGLFLSNNGGDTWTRLAGHGLPNPPVGKIAVNFAPSDERRVYALIETGQGGTLWRSDTGGQSWKVVNYSRLLNERPHYYTRMLVMPDNLNEVYFPSNGINVTFDGGLTADHMKCPGDNPVPPETEAEPGSEEAAAEEERRSERCGGDNHDMWADPVNPNRMMIGNDGGVLISTARGRDWKHIRLPIAQIYHLAVDNRIPYYVYGQMQDGSPQRGPSMVIGEDNINPSEWTTTAGCETGWNIPDPVDNNIIWGGCYAGLTERADLRIGFARTVSVWPDRTMGANAGQVKFRMNWTYPIAISPHDHNIVYAGSQYVHKTTDGGQTWRTISPDLTLNDPSMLGDSGGLTIDNLSVEYAGVVFALAESPLEKGQIWAGTNDGQLQVTRDDGKSWTNVTSHIPGLPPKMTVSSIEPSKYGAGVCYVAYDGHQVNIRDPYLYKTTDFGKTWTRITTGIPDSQLSYTHVVREDPVRQALLYAGTENGFYVSFDDGGHWESFQQNLPHAPVHWLAIQPQFNDLVVGTYGRGFWILDDLTPLQQMQPQVRDSAAFLFPVRLAYRFRAGIKRNMAPVGTSAGKNHPYGGDINYFLKSETPKDKISLVVLDSDGKQVRKLKPSGKPGINRLWWNLRYEPVLKVALRTTPPGNPHIWEEKRFAGKAARPIFYYGVGRQDIDAPLVPPGAYTIKLEVGGETLTQKMTVLKDPNTSAGEQEVMESSSFCYRIYSDANESARLINQVEWTRKQLEDTRKMLLDNKADKSLLDAGAKLDDQYLSAENNLMHPTIAEGDEKSFRGPLGLYLKFIWLGAEAGTGGGDVTGNSDFKPTQPELEVFDLLHKQLEETKAAIDDLNSHATAVYNNTLQSSGVLRIVTVKSQ